MGTHLLTSDVCRQRPHSAAAEDNPPNFQNRALLDTLRRFDDETVAEAWLIAQRWPGGIRCPRCDSDNIAEPPDRRPMPYRCRNCRTQFSVKSHSAMRASKHSLTTWV